MTRLGLKGSIFGHLKAGSGPTGGNDQWEPRTSSAAAEPNSASASTTSQVSSGSTSDRSDATKPANPSPACKAPDSSPGNSRSPSTSSPAATPLSPAVGGPIGPDCLTALTRPDRSTSPTKGPRSLSLRPPNLTSPTSSPGGLNCSPIPTRYSAGTSSTTPTTAPAVPCSSNSTST